MIEAALNKGNFNHTSHPKNLDFDLPDEGIAIECKQFHSPRISEQMSRVDNIIVVQGRKAAEFMSKLLRK